MNEAHDPALRALLLHRLAPEAAAALEDRILLEDDFAETLELARTDLLDDYAMDRLDAADRAAVEQCLLQTPEDRHRVALARALFTRKAARHSRRWLLPAGAALAACLALVIVLPRFQSRTSVTAPVIGAVSETGQQQATAQSTASTASPAYAVTLLAEAERGAASRHIDIPARAGVVHLQLEVPQPVDAAQNATPFQVVIRDETGERFAVAGLQPRDIGPYRIVELDVPRTAAGEGTRQIVLSQGAAAGGREVFTWQVQFATAQ